MRIDFVDPDSYARKHHDYSVYFTTKDLVVRLAKFRDKLKALKYKIGDAVVVKNISGHYFGLICAQKDEESAKRDDFEKCMCSLVPYLEQLKKGTVLISSCPFIDAVVDYITNNFAQYDIEFRIDLSSSWIKCDENGYFCKKLVNQKPAVKVIYLTPSSRMVSREDPYGRTHKEKESYDELNPQCQFGQGVENVPSLYVPKNKLINNKLVCGDRFWLNHFSFGTGIYELYEVTEEESSDAVLVKRVD